MVAKVLTAWYGRAFNEGVLKRLQDPKPGWFANSHVIISFTGVKSGKQYTLPVNYRETPQGTITVGTESGWWHNLKHGARVELVIKGESRSGYATLLTANDERRELLGQMLTGFSWRFFSDSMYIFEIEIEK